MSKGKRWLLGILGVLVAATGLGAAALGIAAAQEGVSMKAQLCVVLLQVLRAKSHMLTGEAFRDTVQQNRPRGEAPPPPSLEKTFTITRETVDGADVVTLTPRSGRWDRTVFYLHGGAYVGEISSGHWEFFGRIGERTGARFVVPLYPLAPEHDWKTAYAMVGHAYEKLVAETSPASITIAGDSAGGGFALGFTEALRDEGKPLPSGVLLLSPWLNLVRDNPAQAALEARDPVLSRDGLEWAAEQWAKGTPLEDPHISPVLGSLAGLPPILVFSGTRDLLNPDSRLLAENAKAQNVPLTYIEGHHMTHIWIGLPIPETQVVYDKVAAFLLGTQ